MNTKTLRTLPAGAPRFAAARAGTQDPMVDRGDHTAERNKFILGYSGKW